MNEIHDVPRAHDPIAKSLTPADDRILLCHWLPPQEGFIPRIRIGERAAIEFVHDFADLGAGEGGYNEDHQFYGYRMPI